MSAERVTYLDASAIVKLIVREPESARLSRYLRGRTPVSSVLSRVEVQRAVRPLGRAVHERAEAALARIELVRINDRVTRRAGAIGPDDLRSLDAIHLATAELFGDSLAVIVTYDARLGDAARSLGMRVAEPGS